MPNPAKLTAASVREPRRALTNALAFMRLLWGVDHLLRSFSKQTQARLCISGPRRLVLQIVGRHPQVVASRRRATRLASAG